MSAVVVMYLALMVGEFVKQDVREWCPVTTGPVTSLDLMALSKGSWRGSRIGLPLLPVPRRTNNIHLQDQHTYHEGSDCA